MNHMLDAVVVGVGSGGTLTGLSRYFARVAPHVEMLLADPLGSVLTDVVRSGSIQKPAGSWLIEGIGEDFVPPNCELDRVRERSEEHTSELQSLMRISYAVFCLKKKKKIHAYILTH